MQFHTYSPPQLLAPFVDYFWSVSLPDRQTSAAPTPKPERYLPGGIPELVITLAGEGIRESSPDRPDRIECVPRMLLRGGYSQWYRAVGSATMCLGVQFKPGGAAPFLPLPANEIANAGVDLETLWGRRAVELYERLLEARTNAARVRLLAHAMIAQALSPQPLMRRDSHPLTHHPAVAYALQTFHTSPHPQTIGELVEQIGFSHRYFNALFRAEVGLSPKQYHNVHRFFAVLRAIQNEQSIAWTDIALAYGYYDQAHLVNDFRFFAGMSPTVYLRSRIEGFISIVRDVNDVRDGSNESANSASSNPGGATSAVTLRG